MLSFRDCDPRESFSRLGVLLTRSLLLRDGAVCERLCAFLGALNSGDMMLCSREYHSMLFELASCPSRRVSGDLWRDYLLHTLLCTPHAFARQSAAGKTDEAVSSLMKTELSILGALSTLEDSALVNIAQGRMRELKLRSRQAKDNIELYSTAVWSGAASRPLPKQEEQRASFPAGAELDFTSWKYGEEGLRDSYVADEALEELYLRLLADHKWEEQLETLRCFFSAYGCGEFLRSRAFRYSGGRLCPLPSDTLSPLPAPVCFPEEHDFILDRVIAFMQGEAPSHLFIYADSGMGKTAQMLSAVYELPEVRLVIADESANISVLLSLLGSQPLKFLLFFDGVEPSCIDSPELFPLPENVMLAISSKTDDCPEWACRVALPALRPERFTSFVEDVMEERMILCPTAHTYKACADYQNISHGRLTVAGALRLAESLRGAGS